MVLNRHINSSSINNNKQQTHNKSAVNGRLFYYWLVLSASANLKLILIGSIGRPHCFIAVTQFQKVMHSKKHNVRNFLGILLHLVV